MTGIFIFRVASMLTSPLPSWLSRRHGSGIVIPSAPHCLFKLCQKLQESSYDYHQHHGTKCACASVLFQELLVTLLCRGMCILTDLTCETNGLCSLTVEGSWGARQLALKMSWQCAENCDKMFWALRRTVSNVSSYSAMISECIALGVKGTDIAVNARTPEWNKVEHTELNVAVTLAARFLC